MKILGRIKRSLPERKRRIYFDGRRKSRRIFGYNNGNRPHSVRIIEDGAIRTVVEALFSYHDSFLVRRYYFPKNSSEFTIKDKVYWNEKMTMLKLSLNTVCGDTFIGQTAYGSETLLTNGDEW